MIWWQRCEYRGWFALQTLESWDLPLEIQGSRTCIDKPVTFSDTSHIQCTHGNQGELLAFYIWKVCMQDLPAGRSLAVSHRPWRAIQMLASMKNKTVSQSLPMQVQRLRLDLGNLLQEHGRELPGANMATRLLSECHWSVPCKCAGADWCINKQALNQALLIFFVSWNLIKS